MNNQEKRKLKPAPLQRSKTISAGKMLWTVRSFPLINSALTSWGRCLRSSLCTIALWGLLLVSDPQDPGADPEGYTPPPGGPRSTEPDRRPIWRRIDMWIVPESFFLHWSCETEPPGFLPDVFCSLYFRWEPVDHPLRLIQGPQHIVQSWQVDFTGNLGNLFDHIIQRFFAI